MGQAFVFLRPNTPPGLGHTGWALEAEGKYYAGGTERRTDDPQTWARFLQGVGSGNPFHRYLYLTVDPGQNNGAWVAERLPSWNDVLHEMKRRGYSEWKGYSVANPNLAAAMAHARTIESRGWSVLFNNCLDHACEVLERFGVPWQQVGGNPKDAMPWKQTHLSPNHWFHDWKVQRHVF